MKKLIVLFVLFAGISASHAQLPEFSLHVKLFVNNDFAKTVIFGYDTAASDAMVYKKESWFSDEFSGGEQEYPPGQPGDLDFRMFGAYIERPELQDGGPIDIRKKPALDSFTLKYGIKLIVVHGTTNAKIVWNPDFIPPIIKHITLASYKFPSKIRLDMKNVSEFVIPLKDSGEELYSNMILTLYYNKEIDPPLNVVSAMALKDFFLYPNPMDSRSKLHFTINGDSRLSLSVYDITGKKIYERFINAQEGNNAIDLSKNDFSSHPGVYLIRLNGDRFEKSSTIIVR